MAISPNTTLKLLKVPIELDNKNQLNFTSKQAQFNYFNNCESIEIENISYQRKNGIIRFPRPH